MIGVVALGVMAAAGVYSSVQVQQAHHTSDAQLAAERQAHRTSEAQMAAERQAHAAVLAAERQAHAAVLAAERQAHLATSEKLRYELLNISDEELATCSQAKYVELCAQYGVPCRLSVKRDTQSRSCSFISRRSERQERGERTRLLIPV